MAVLNASLQSVMLGGVAPPGTASGPAHKSAASSAAPSPALSQGGPFYTHQQLIPGRKDLDYGHAALHATSSLGEMAGVAGGSRGMSLEPTQGRTLLHMVSHSITSPYVCLVACGRGHACVI